MMQINDTVYYNMMIEYTHARWQYYCRMTARYCHYTMPNKWKRYTMLGIMEYDAYTAFTKASFAKLLYEEELQAKRLKDAGLT